MIRGNLKNARFHKTNEFFLEDFDKNDRFYFTNDFLKKILTNFWKNDLNEQFY